MLKISTAIYNKHIDITETLIEVTNVHVISKIKLDSLKHAAKYKTENLIEEFCEISDISDDVDVKISSPTAYINNSLKEYDLHVTEVPKFVMDLYSKQFTGATTMEGGIKYHISRNNLFIQTLNGHTIYITC